MPLNSVQDTRPDLVQRWHPTKNGDLKPSDVARGSSVGVWWLCPDCGYDWKASPNSLRNWRRCSVCSGRTVLVGVSDLATTHEALAAEWHPTKNGDLKPSDVTRTSRTRVWWACSRCKHEWRNTIAGRAAGQGCGVCAGKRLGSGVNDLQTTRPDLAAEWHPTKNGDLKPFDVARTSRTRVWWACSRCKHEWLTSVNSRAVSGTGCPECAKGRFLRVGVNDLGTVRPQVASQWHPTKNGDLRPTDITYGSAQPVWWLCTVCGYEWETSPLRRGNRGCRRCAARTLAEKRTVAPQGLSLAAANPAMAAQWHPTRNGNLTPDTVWPSAHVAAWWLCAECGCEWMAKPCDRTQHKTGCPDCGYVAMSVARSVPAPGRSLADVDPGLAAQLHPTKNGDQTGATIAFMSNRRVWWLCPTCQCEWESTVANRAGGSGCPTCRPPSRAEVEISAIIGDLLAPAPVETQARIFGGQWRADVYVPGRHIAVEFNGLYWHHDGRVAPDHHVTRTSLAAARGVRLVHVWEDDWRDRREIVIRMLAAKLGATERLAKVLPDLDPECWQRVGARSLRVTEADARTARAFLDANHIQGAVTLSRRFVLLDGHGHVRALLGLRSPRSNARMKRQAGQWEITRYATRGVVPGGFSRLLAHAERTLQAEGADLTEWVTFAASDASDGGMYEACGFAADRSLPPDYRYVGPITDWKRAPKESFQRKRFRDDPRLAWDDSWTEAVAARENGLFRVWDCGKTRYVRAADGGRQ